MNKILRLVLAGAMLIAPFSLNARVIKGTILNSDGKPAPMAHVHYLDNDKYLGVQTDKAGKFTLDVKNKAGVELLFSGVNLDYLRQFVFLAPGAANEIEINAFLKPTIPNPKFESIFIPGNFNNYSFQTGMVEAEKVSDKIYKAKIKSVSDTLIYQVFYYTPRTQARSVNGPQADYYVYDGMGDYRSCIATKAGSEIEITIDLNNLPTNVKPGFINSGNKDFDDYLKKVEAINYLKFEYTKSRLKLKIGKDEETNASIIAENKKNYLDKLSDKISSENDINAKFFALIKYFEIAGDAATWEIAKTYTDKSFASTLIVLAGSNYSVMKEYPEAFITAAIVAKEFPVGNFLDNYLSSVTNEIDAFNMLQPALDYTYNYEEIAAFKKYYSYLDSKYGNSEIAKSIKMKYGLDKKINIGAKAPDFQGSNLSNASVTVKYSDYQGDYLLLYFWGSWQVACDKEIPKVDSIANLFAKKGLKTVGISLDQNKDKAIEYLTKQLKISSPQILLEKSFKDKIAQDYEVSNVPTVLLIGPDGAIKALNKDLKSDKLYKTLKKLVK